MKTQILSLFCLAAVSMIHDSLFAQYTPTIEFATGMGPSGTGPSIAAQTVTFENNPNNPTGSTFAAYTTPTTTATFSLSNQQYPLSSAYSGTGASVVFGGGNNLSQKKINALNYYYPMNDYSSPVNGDFTSAGTITAGTGIDVTANYSLQIFTSVMGLYLAGASTTGTYYMGDLTITFNTLVTNPVIHLVGMGGNYGTLGFSNELELATPSLTLTRLSGSPEFAVSGGQILNTANPIGGTTGSGGASGSVLVTGTNITSMTFHINLRADGNGSAWAASTVTSGDGFMIAVSALSVNTVLPLSITSFTAAPRNTGVQLEWDAASGGNSSFFDIGASTDGKTWQDIGMVMTTGNTNTYNYTVANPASGKNFYRIEEVDALGNAIYSPVETVDIAEQPAATKVFPNPVKNRLFIIDNGRPIRSVIVTGTDGKEMARYNGPAIGNSIDMSYLPGGIYFVTISYASGPKQTTKIIKER